MKVLRGESSDERVEGESSHERVKGRNPAMKELRGGIQP